jgi:hypothetical protein
MRTLLKALPLLVLGAVACKQPPPQPQVQPPQAAEPLLPAPKIEDLQVEDLADFLGGTRWCRRAATGDERHVFDADGRFARALPGASEPLEEGTWTVDQPSEAENRRIVLRLPDGSSRAINVEVGQVDEQTVLVLDGRLYAPCDR